MRRCLPPLALLAALLAFSVWNSRYLSAQTLRWQEELRRAEALAQSEDWGGAQRALSGGYADWSAHQTRLHIVTRHDVLADAEALYQRCMAYAAAQEAVEFQAEAAALRDRLRLLAEMERFSLGNVLTAPAFPRGACSAPP